MTKNKQSRSNRYKSTGLIAIFFIATSAVVAAAVYVTIQEGRRIKEENKLLAYEVW